MAVTGVVAGQYGTKIPDVNYGKTWLVKWYLKTDFRNITSTTYESDLQVGHTVRIRIKPDITINTYTANAAITFERPTTTKVDMVIDQALYFATAEDKVETKQSDMDNRAAWLDDGMKKMEIAVENDCYGVFYTEANAQNAGATAGADGNYNLGTKALPVVVTKANIVNYIGLHALALDDFDVPDEDRNIVLPKWCRNLIAESDEFKAANETGDAKTALRDRFIGSVQGFKIYLSNNLTKEADGGTGDDIVYNIFAAHKASLQFAGQLKVEGSVDFEKEFGTGDKALFVYGRKATENTGVTHGVITATAIS